jgi:outer membrane protein assembly factor BamB
VAVFSTESGMLAAYGFDGARVWCRDLGPQASAPSVAGERVLVGLADGTVRCLSLEDGSDLWSADLESGDLRAVVGRPVVSGDRAVAGTGHSRVACISLEDGNVLWNREMENWVQVPPAVGDSTVYVSCDDKRLHLLSLSDGSGVDSLEIGSYSGTAPTVSAGVVYLGTAGGRMAALRGRVPVTPEESAPDSAVAGDAPSAPDPTGGGGGL